MNLTITWDNPTPHAICGYKAQYRRKGDSAYTTLTTSGSTSGETSVIAIVDTPASYEGIVQSNCCSSNYSPGIPFGVNAYQPFSIGISVQQDPLAYIATVTSTYGNPYPTLISGTFDSSGSTLSYSCTYPADSTSSVITLSNSPGSGNVNVTNVTVTAISPVFDNGGTLQQLDTVSTPKYFQFYHTSGTTWNGASTVLPSFTLDIFNVTETDTFGNVTAGNLLVSWIQESVYGAGASPYNIITFKVYDGSTIIGHVTYDPTILGLRNVTIALVKGTQALTTDSLFSLRSYWSDTSLIVSKNFYLPG